MTARAVGPPAALTESSHETGKPGGEQAKGRSRVEFKTSALGLPLSAAWIVLHGSARVPHWAALLLSGPVLAYRTSATPLLTHTK